MGIRFKTCLTVIPLRYMGIEKHNDVLSSSHAKNLFEVLPCLPLETPYGFPRELFFIGLDLFQTVSEGVQIIFTLKDRFSQSKYYSRKRN